MSNIQRHDPFGKKPDFNLEGWIFSVPAMILQEKGIFLRVLEYAKENYAVGVGRIERVYGVVGAHVWIDPDGSHVYAIWFPQGTSVRGTPTTLGCPNNVLPTETHIKAIGVEGGLFLAPSPELLERLATGNYITPEFYQRHKRLDFH